MRLETERLVLRDITEDDIDAVFGIYSKGKKYFQYTRIPHPYGREDAEAFVSKVIEGYQTLESFYVAIIERKSKRFIGSISINRFSHADDFAEVGYSVGEEFAGRGYVTEAASAFIDYCFRRFDLNRIEIHAAVDNQASLRIIEKLGAKKEGRSRQSVRARNGYLDEYNFSILRKEWKRKGGYRLVE